MKSYYFGLLLMMGVMLWSQSDERPPNPSAFFRGGMWGAGCVLICLHLVREREWE